MISLGSEGSLSPTTLFVGIATLYLAFKLAHQPLLGAIYGDAQRGASLAGSFMALVAAEKGGVLWFMQVFGETGKIRHLA